MSVSVVCNWIHTSTVSHSSASVHCWPCPVLSAKEMSSMKVAVACDIVCVRYYGESAEFTVV